MYNLPASLKFQRFFDGGKSNVRALREDLTPFSGARVGLLMIIWKGGMPCYNWVLALTAFQINSSRESVLMRATYRWKTGKGSLVFKENPSSHPKGANRLSLSICMACISVFWWQGEKKPPRA
jgi:hypothetical protein